MKRRKGVLVMLTIGGLLLVVATLVAAWSIYRFKVGEFSSFEVQSTELADVFSRGSVRWISQSNAGALQSMTSILLAGSGQYVRIVVVNDVIVDEGAESIEIPALVHSSLEVDSVKPMAVARDGGLDVVSPLSFPNRPGVNVGYVQIGFSDNTVMSRVWKYMRLISGIAIGSWAFLMVVSALLYRIFSLRRQLAVASSVTAPSGVIRAGAIEIDTDASCVHLAGVRIDLTPKLFDMLAFLAMNAGKTCSDDELLQALWADSPYAAPNDVKQCIYLLRRRLRAGHPAPKQVVVNVKGFGYKLVPPDEADFSAH